MSLRSTVFKLTSLFPIVGLKWLRGKYKLYWFHVLIIYFIWAKIKAACIYLTRVKNKNKCYIFNLVSYRKFSSDDTTWLSKSSQIRPKMRKFLPHYDMLSTHKSELQNHTIIGQFYIALLQLCWKLVEYLFWSKYRSQWNNWLLKDENIFYIIFGIRLINKALDKMSQWHKKFTWNIFCTYL